METYTFNSLESKPTDNKDKDEKTEAVATAKVKDKKSKKPKNKLMALLIPEDVGAVKEHVLGDLIIPRLLTLAYDIICDSAAAWLGVEKSSKSRSSRHIPYSSLSDRDERRDSKKQTYTYEDIMFESESEANDVLDFMKERIERSPHHNVSILQYYDAAGLGYLTSHSDNNYGWTDLSRVDIVKEYNRDDRRYEYSLRMPRPRHLED